MNILNTADSRFANIPDYPFLPNYLEVETGLRMHYVDEGPRDGEIVLLLHGEPSWSFLYRKMIPVFANAGYRVLAPDLIGFGKSSKPTETTDYSYALHIQWVQTWLAALDLKDITLFAQDWGGLIGLRLVTAEPERFSRVAVGNTGLPTGDQKMPKAFIQWQQFSQTVAVFPFEMIMQESTVGKLSQEILDAYTAPFPNASYIAGARIFPAFVPTTSDDVESENNRNAWKILQQWEKPFLTLFSDSDPVTKGGEVPFQKFVPGAKDQPHKIIEQAGHFLQEDKGEEIANYLVEWMNEV